MWARAGRRLRVLHGAQIALLIIMAGAILTATMILGNEISQADDEAERASAHLSAVVEARDVLRTQESAFWRDRAGGGEGLTSNTLSGFSKASADLRRLAVDEERIPGPGRVAPRRAALEELDALDGLLGGTAREGAAANQRASAEGVMGRMGEASDNWVAANRLEVDAARGRARDLINSLMWWLIGVIGVLTAAGLGVWLLLARARARIMGALQESEDRLRALIQDLVLVVDSEGHIAYSSPSAQRILGYSEGELAGRGLATLVHPDDAVPLDELSEGADTSAGGELVTWRLHRRDATWLYAETLVSDLSDDPVIDGLVLNCRDVSDRVEAEALLAHRAFHDPLTDLPNRALFEDRLAHALERARRGGDRLAVLMLDLDDFKTVNDSLGHAAGDQLLVCAAERIAGTLRTSDTAARLGGDEFAVLLEGAGSEEEAGIAARRISHALSEPHPIDGHEIVPQASIGVALAEAGSTPSALLRQADIAMYSAKDAGKGGQAMFHETLEESARRRLALKSQLRGAVERRELCLSYQPIVELDTGRVRAVEALIRWHHPDHGEIHPAEFIPLAEETGIIRPIGAWVLEEACREAASWEQLLPGRAPSVSVNLSARQLDSTELPELAAAALKESGLDPASLVLEVTESVLMSDVPSSEGALRRLTALGARIAIDDFGTGYSSLRYLGRLPVDLVKMDKSFVVSIVDERRDADLARAILRLGEVLDLDTVAEGVESAEQASALRGIGFRLAQGYYFSEPVPEDELARLLVDGLPAARELAAP